MIDWELVKKEHEKLSQELSNSNLDKKERKDFQRKFSQFSELLDSHEQIVELEKNITEHEKQLNESDDDMKELFEEEK